MAIAKNIELLIKNCLARDGQAQRQLVDQYSGFLACICRRYLKDQDQVKDLLQDSFIRIFQNLHQYKRSLGSFESWISTIAIRLCLTKIKKNKFTTISIDDQTINSQSMLIEANALDDIDTELVIQFISELPSIYRIVFNLAAIDGYSHKEIADLLNISEIASRSRLNRGKSILRKRVNALTKAESWVNTI